VFRINGAPNSTPRPIVFKTADKAPTTLIAARENALSLFYRARPT
jgi:hypothetical protein